MNLKIPGAILPLCRVFLSTGVKTVWGGLLQPAFEIAVVRSPETTKTCVGQPKIMIWLSGGQPKSKSQKLLFSIVWSNLSNLLFINWHSLHFIGRKYSCFGLRQLTDIQNLWRTTRNYNLVVRGTTSFIFLIRTLVATPLRRTRVKDWTFKYISINLIICKNRPTIF